VTLHSGDVWFDTDNDNEIKIYNGNAWVSTSLGENALDILYVARAVCAYLDVNSLSAEDAQILFATFKQIKSQDGLSYWDLETGKFVTKDGEFTGTITGSTLATEPGAQKVVTVEVGGASASDGSTADGKIVVQPTGLQAVRNNAAETMRAQFLQAMMREYDGLSYKSLGYGWYSDGPIYAPNFYTSMGKVMCEGDMSSYAEYSDITSVVNGALGNRTSATTPATGVSGITGSVWGKMATLVFNGFSIPSGTAAGEWLADLNEVYWPKNQLDLVSNLNAQRIFVDTDGEITSYKGNSGTGALAFRCTVSYVRNVS